LTCEQGGANSPRRNIKGQCGGREKKRRPQVSDGREQRGPGEYVDDARREEKAGRAGKIYRAE
jgi:hypothetical protein